MSVVDENNIPELIDVLGPAAADAVSETAHDAFQEQQSNWESGRDATGLPWVPLSPETIRRKGGTRILIDTGQMKDDMAVSVDRGEKTARIGPTSDRSAELLSYHEFGVPENNLPARPVLRPTHDRAETIAGDAFEDTLGDAIDPLLI